MAENPKKRKQMEKPTSANSTMRLSWTWEQNKAFEVALAKYDEYPEPDKWQNIAKEVGKSEDEVKRHFEILQKDLNAIERGETENPIPPYADRCVSGIVRSGDTSVGTSDAGTEPSPSST